jgi:hydrogenase-4 component H
MSIIDVLLRNLTTRGRTRTVADVVPTPAGFRGMIEHDASLCTACNACAQVCAPKAISIDKTGGASVTWQFFAGQCSYCGLCVQYCPTHAITNQGQLPPVTDDPSLHRIAHTVELRACAHCGVPVIPLPDAVLHELYGGPLPPSVVKQHLLCDGCRRRETSQGIRDAFLGRKADQEGKTG